MIHATSFSFEYKEHEWKPMNYRLNDCVEWSEKGTEIRVGNGNNKETLRIIPGAFWNKDAYSSGETVIVLERSRSAFQGKEACLIVSQSFVSALCGSAVNADTIRNLLEFPGLSADEQHFIGGYMNHELISEGDLPTRPDFITPTNMKQIYELVKSRMLPAQRSAGERWMSQLRTSKNYEKLKMLLSICPDNPYRDRTTITFESVLNCLDDQLEGYETLKKTLARIISQKAARDSKRGTVILIHGLPGTGKTQLGRAIGKAQKMPVCEINMGGISSTLSLSGCESPYDNATAGRPFQFCYQEKTSEVLFILDEIDKLLKYGTDRGKDGNVVEALLKMMDPSNPSICDSFADGVPISCENTWYILIANRIDNLPEELLNRCAYIFHLEPLDEATLLTIAGKQKQVQASRYDLPDYWIDDEALSELLRYRGDFGARDVIKYLETLAGAAMEYKLPLTKEDVRCSLEKTLDLETPAIRYHMNEHLYSKDQRRAILDAFSRHASASNLSDQERRSLELKLDYLTALVPRPLHSFNIESFFEVARANLSACDKPLERIASEFYCADKLNMKPGRMLLVGPPGTGKTSIFEAIAAATGRAVVRIQLSSLTSPEQINGNSPIFVGANSGIIFKELSKARANNALIILDELDKASKDVCEALLTLTDGGRFFDNFTETWLDLSDTYIGGTANDTSAIDAAMLSRFEVVEVPGYFGEEKRLIAEKHLLPQLLKGTDIRFTPEALDEVLMRYETDCGIRTVKHALRAVVQQSVTKQPQNTEVTIRREDVHRILGSANNYIYLADNAPGCVNGLATRGSSSGIVMPIRVTLLHNGEQRITGLPEDCIRESISVVKTWLEECFGYSLINGYHIHLVPGGVNKDGPSAGLAIAVAMLSALSGQPVGSAAFTGEFDGQNILPVGGVLLKIQAAQSAGIENMYLPESCREMLNGRKFSINLHFLSTIDQLVKELFPQLCLAPKTALNETCHNLMK